MYYLPIGYVLLFTFQNMKGFEAHLVPKISGKKVWTGTNSIILTTTL